MHPARTICLAALLASVAFPSFAKSIVRCTAPSKADVILTLDAHRTLGRTVSCISGDFIMDMAPCASNGGIGLSRPTGAADLVKIVDRWQDAMDHLGGAMSYWSNSTQINFSGGFRNGRGGISDEWSFVADRLSGKGILKLNDKQAVNYACAVAKQRF